MKRISRRQLFQMTGGIALASMIPITRSSRAGMWSQIFGTTKRDVSPITPNEEFFITSYRTPPFIPAEQWALNFRGFVKNPFTMTYAQLLAQPTVSEIVTLECVGNGIAGEAIGTAEWKGVRLNTLLERAGVNSHAVDVVFHAADGYSDSLPIERAMQHEVLLAYGMNGVPLPLGHGFPARMIVPGLYVMKHVQWLTGIELINSDYKGYYPQKGLSDTAIVQTMSWITDPQTGDTFRSQTAIELKGFAFAGTRGIRKVELITDGGQTWEPATLAPPLSPYSWVFWTYQWNPRRQGDHRLIARSTDGSGSIQPSIEQGAFPEGTSGRQEVIVSVG